MYSEIKELCRKHNISVSQLEIELGFSRGSICKWDNNVPTITKVKAVADYFEISIDELILRKEKKMNNLQIFKNPEFGQVRTIMRNDEPWFVGKDVAKALGYKDTVNAIKTHVADEDKGGWRITTQFGEKETTIINESGLYALIFGSKLPSAKKFKRWVTSEVLPAIRKTGHYGATPLKDIVSLIRITRDNMERQGATPTQIAETIDGICKQYGIILPNFVIKPEALTLQDAYDMIDFIYSQPRGKGHKKTTFDDFIAYKASTKMLGE